MFTYSKLSLCSGLLFVMFSIGVANAVVSKEAKSTRPLGLATAQQLALSENPRLAEIDARYQAALEVPSQMSALPDPVLSLGFANLPTDTFDLDQDNMTQLQVGISQSLPWASERRLAASSAQYMATATAFELEEAKNRLVRDVTTSWWSLYFIEKALLIVDQNIDRLREFNQIALSRYRVGKGLQQDTLQAQLQLSSQLERQLVLRNQYQFVAAQLNALLASPAEQAVQIDLAEPVATANLPNVERLISRALGQRPLLLKGQALVDAARDRRELAEEGLLPDLTLGAKYGYRQDAPNGSSRADLFSFNVGIRLPIYAEQKQYRQIDQRGAELIAQKEALYSSQLAVRQDVVQAVVSYQRTIDQLTILNEGMIPQSKQTVASMLSGYQVGKVDFSALIQAQLMVNRLQLQYWQVTTESQKALANLRAAIGIDVSENLTSDTLTPEFF